MKTSTPKSETEASVKAEHTKEKEGPAAATQENKSGRHAASHVKTSTGTGAGGGKKQKHGG